MLRGVRQVRLQPDETSPVRRAYRPGRADQPVLAALRSDEGELFPVELSQVCLSSWLLERPRQVSKLQGQRVCPVWRARQPQALLQAAVQHPAWAQQSELPPQEPVLQSVQRRRVS